MSGLLFLAVYVHAQLAAMPNAAELGEARQWVAAKFLGTVETPLPSPGLHVVANHDPVQLNNRNGRPMRIGSVEYTQGLYCHAPSEIIVRLPRPGTFFESTAGVDSNEQTSGGRGSVAFSVSVAGREAWRSDVLREGIPGVPVSVALEGATEFVLAVSATDDGISCDQADWANARVTFDDGSEIQLSDLPLLAGQRKPYDSTPFFSFVYGDKPSSELLPQWRMERASRPLDGARTEHTLTYTDPVTGLVASVVGVAYADFPTVEWTLYFKNTGENDTPILRDIRTIDTAFERAGAEYVLHGNKGDDCTADSFEPYDEVLKPDSVKRVRNERGRPTQIGWPYFNIESAPEGLIFVLSWGGQWDAAFTRDGGTGLRVSAGQEKPHFKLLAGEEVRAPMAVLQFYKGDKQRAQNVWRAWMIAHNIPRPGGKLPPLPQLAACSSHQFSEMINANRDNQIFFVDKYLERGLKLDYWWMDAGWYPCDGQWPKTGTWEVDTNRFPGGLRVISDHAREKGVRTIVWFEPERVHSDTWLTENHPDWVHGGKKGGLLKLNEPAVLQWLINHIDKLIVEQGIDLYRQDFNMDPLDSWRENDTEDRQGITEIRHIENYYAYWDELRRRHPDMLIDSCASGGRRNDLETLRRAVPLLRSDYIMEPTGNQCHTWALSSWLPFYGTGSSKTDEYNIRSTLCPHYIACWDQRDDTIDFGRIKQMVDQWKEFGPCYFGDYYPLTSYTLRHDQWVAWQFHKPDTDEGIVQAFRRQDSPYESVSVPLSGLIASQSYRVFNVDRPDDGYETDGATLMNGLQIAIGYKPGTAFVRYMAK